MTAIRKITSEDRDFFIAASKAFYASAAVAHDVPASYHLTTFEELMNSEVYQSGYILEVDGASVGYALVSKTFSHEAGGTVWWLEELYILPEYRGKGLGRSYFDFIEKAAQALGERFGVRAGDDGLPYGRAYADTRAVIRSCRTLVPLSRLPRPGMYNQ